MGSGDDRQAGTGRRRTRPPPFISVSVNGAAIGAKAAATAMQAPPPDSPGILRVRRRNEDPCGHLLRIHTLRLLSVVNTIAADRPKSSLEKSVTA
jgi:hypothetical protein